MDNLTHSLVGALIGQMGLKRKTGLAMPTLIIAANIPDIDALAVLLGGHQHLAIRRGITHGPIAMVVLPLLLWAAMLWFDGRQTRRGTRPEKRLPVHKGWLLALAFIGCLTHPAFDWLNNYGVRLLEPFSSQWFYGDSIFIIDVWLLVIPILGIGWSLRREQRENDRWRWPAISAFSILSIYVAGNITITGLAQDYAREAIGRRLSMISVSPVPFAVWRREIFWQSPNAYGSGMFDLLGPDVIGPSQGDRSAFADPRAGTTTATDKDASAFLFWSRMPVGRIESGRRGDMLVLSDQRFGNPVVSDRFTVKVNLPSKRE